MNTEKISAVYARALTEVAQARGMVPRLVEEFALLEEILATQPRVEAFLATPNVAEEDKMAALNRALGSEVSGTFRSFLGVTLARRRGGLLREMADLFRREADALSGTARAWVKSAVPLEDETCRHLRRALEERLGRTVVLEKKVDASVLGGLKVRVGDSVLDGTLLTRLGELRKRMEAGKIRGEVGYED